MLLKQRLGIVTGVLSGWKQMARTLSPDITIPYPVLSLCEIRVEETSQVIGPESAQAQDGIRYRRPYILMREVAMKNGRLPPEV
tara:strand:+ start:92 stop:343 length:252 start_codon:yes stop_codon:yes gene_type:complete